MEQRLAHEGLFVATGKDRLTNTRYADDSLLYAKSLPELQSMAESLIQDLAAVGLKLNAGKTKILHTSYKEIGHDLDFIEIDGESVRILHSG